MPNDTRSGLKISGKRTSTLLKQCEIILTENGKNGSQHPKKSFRVSFKKPGELFLKTTQRNDKKKNV